LQDRRPIREQADDSEFRVFQYLEDGVKQKRITIG
jgi:hypothetical protein